jgi:hypothetical protein
MLDDMVDVIERGQSYGISSVLLNLELDDKVLDVFICQVSN